MEQAVKQDLQEAIAQTFDVPGGDVNQLSPLTLAYIGDSIYALVTKTIIVNRANCPAAQLHNKTVRYVAAAPQARIAEYLQEEGVLTEKETAVLKRGRNAKSASTAKNASLGDYRLATGLEALIGYLYLNKETDRMLELMKLGFDFIDKR